MRTIYNHSRAAASVLSIAVLTATCISVDSAPKSSAKTKSSSTTAKKGTPTKTTPAKAAALRLKRHNFPDVSMGIPAAYTVMLPPNWSATGKIEWQPVGEVPFPQQIIEITSPQQGKINMQPLATFGYLESDMTGREGVPAPENIVEWLVQAAPQIDPNVSNVKIIRSNRVTQVEEAMKKMDIATGGGMQREVHGIVMEYDEGKVRRREEFQLTYVRFQPYVSQGLRSQMWSLAPSTSISAPASSFAAQRTALLNVARTLQATPQWHIQSQAAIAEMSRQRTANNWEIIKARGRQISQVSDSQYDQYKKDMGRGDAAQRQRIQGIYETSDYKDANGDIVNLPMHYQYVFSDGKGNYVLSNNSHDKPGASWKSIQPIK